MNTEIQHYMQQLGQTARTASRAMARADTDMKNTALRQMAVLIERHQITHGGQQVHQVLLLTVIVGNLLEKSLALRATFTARSRATFL